MSNEIRPVTVLIGALGGEGGGVLTDWIVSAATAHDLPVQSTSIPGVAQRTGATTYYVEIYPVSMAELGGRYPVMALYPGPGNMDLVVASELLEAGRALELGFVSPDRTTLVASVHRIYAIAEKSAMADGRFDDTRVVEAARELSARALLEDYAALAQAAGSQINAVLLGAMAGVGVLPLPAASFEDAIRRGGKAVDENLRGFHAGLASVSRTAPAAAPSGAVLETPADPAARVAGLPVSVRAVVEEGAALALDYLDSAYADLFLERVESVCAHDDLAGGASHGHALTCECARQLALWMCYEDVVRVADLKSRASRMERIRDEVGAGEGEPVRVTEYLKPGLEEVCAISPPRLSRALRALVGRRRASMSLRIATHSVTGHLVLRGLAGLRRWRRRSERFAAEQALIERWLAAVRTAAGVDYTLALEAVECAALNKGYSETFERGRGSFHGVFDEVLVPALAGADHEAAAGAVRRAREAALADPQGAALASVLVAPPVSSTASRAPTTVTGESR